jgi:hypothetical protein
MFMEKIITFHRVCSRDSIRKVEPPYDGCYKLMAAHGLVAGSTGTLSADAALPV